MRGEPPSQAEGVVASGERTTKNEGERLRAARGARPARLEKRRLSRALPLVVVAAGGGLVAAAGFAVATSRPDAGALAGLLGLFAGALIAEAWPVPVRNIPSRHVSLAAVFIVGAAVLQGWAEAALLAAAVRIAADLAHRREPLRLLYDASVYASGAILAGGVAARFDGSSLGGLVLEVLASSSAYYLAHILLVTASHTSQRRERYLRLLVESAASTAMPFAIMSSGTLMLVVLWQRSPLLSLALVGPLLAIALYQRSLQQGLQATELALTDGLTGLGNLRSFHERLLQELGVTESAGVPLALCLLDVDDLKRVNDTYGHDVGDRLLREVAVRLRDGGDAFRLGGDEFGLLLPGADSARALETARGVLSQITELEVTDGEPLRISCGVAVYPSEGVSRNDLYRAADNALYSSKRLQGDAVLHGSLLSPEMRSISGDL